MKISAALSPALFVALWATGFIGAAYAMPWAEPFTFLAVRFILALILLALLLLLLKPKGTGWRGATHAMIAGALMHGVYLGAVFWAIRHGFPSGFSALIVGLQPLITAIIAGPALGERILPRHWTGLAVGFLGVVIVLSPRLGDISGGVTASTLAASIVSVIGMSAGTIWQKRFVTDVDLVTGTLYQYVGGAVLMTAASLAFETQSYTLNGELVFAMLWLVLVLSIGAIFLLMYLIREGAISKVASLFYLVPSVTAVMAWALFNEKLSLFQIFGMVVATLGVALATQSVPARARASR